MTECKNCKNLTRQNNIGCKKEQKQFRNNGIFSKVIICRHFEKR